MALDLGEEAVSKLGLMHGVPISVKDTIYQKGKLSTFGFNFHCEDIC